MFSDTWKSSSMRHCAGRSHEPARSVLEYIMRGPRFGGRFPRFIASFRSRCTRSASSAVCFRRRLSRRCAEYGSKSTTYRYFGYSCTSTSKKARTVL